MLPAGWLSVGTEVNVKHLAATPVGREVTATARVLTVNERTVLFVVEAHDGIERIGAGTHARAVVNYDRFVRNLPAKRPTLG